jgi:hypothetical protein
VPCPRATAITAHTGCATRCDCCAFERPTGQVVGSGIGVPLIVRALWARSGATSRCANGRATNAKRRRRACLHGTAGGIASRIHQNRLDAVRSVPARGAALHRSICLAELGDAADTSRRGTPPTANDGLGRDSRRADGGCAGEWRAVSAARRVEASGTVGCVDGPQRDS